MVVLEQQSRLATMCEQVRDNGAADADAVFFPQSLTISTTTENLIDTSRGPHIEMKWLNIKP